MDRTLYHDGIEIHGDDLNNTESSKIKALKDRREFVKSGTIGLLVTAGGGNTVNISEGVGYCANGEQIESSGETGVNVIPGQYNFITLIYKEVEGTPKPHENTGDSYNTRVEESYEVLVLEESVYNALSQEDKDNRIVCGIYYDNTHIQTGHDLSRIPISSAIDISGVWIGQYSEKTLDGIGYFEFDRSLMSIRYKAPGDLLWGSWEIITPSWVDSENIKLESDNADYWVYVEILSSLLPVESADAEVNIRDLYNPPVEGNMELGYNTPTSSSVDRFHRGIHLIYPPSVDEDGGISEKNPHGMHSKDLTGYQADVHRHQDLMHCNGILAKEWFLTGESDILKPVCDEDNKKVTITNDLGIDDYYHINGVVFDDVDETFPWEYTFGVGLWYVVLGPDKKFHIFQNSYNTKNYIPIVKVNYGASVPVLYVNKTDLTPSCTVGNNASSADFKVKNCGSGTLNYIIRTDVGWLSCLPVSGALGEHVEEIITVTFLTSSFGVGTYTGHIWIEGTSPALGSPKTIDVVLAVSL